MQAGGYHGLYLEVVYFRLFMDIHSESAGLNQQDIEYPADIVDFLQTPQ